MCGKTKYIFIASNGINWSSRSRGYWQKMNNWSSTGVNIFRKTDVFGSLLDWNIQVHINIVPRKEDINTDLREALVAAHHSRKAHQAISNQSEVHHSTVRKTTQEVENIQGSCQSSQKWTYKRHNKIKLCNAQRNCEKKLKSYISDCIAFSWDVNVKVHDSALRKRLKALLSKIEHNSMAWLQKVPSERTTRVLEQRTLDRCLV